MVNALFLKCVDEHIFDLDQGYAFVRLELHSDFVEEERELLKVIKDLLLKRYLLAFDEHRIGLAKTTFA